MTTNQEDSRVKWVSTIDLIMARFCRIPESVLRMIRFETAVIVPSYKELEILGILAKTSGCLKTTSSNEPDIDGQTHQTIKQINQVLRALLERGLVWRKGERSGHGITRSGRDALREYGSRRAR